MKHFTLTEVNHLVCQEAIKAANKTADDIIENIKIKNKETERGKLQFDLSIAYIFMALDGVSCMANWSQSLRAAVMNGVRDLYFTHLEKFRLKNYVNVASFVRDMSERELVYDRAGVMTAEDLDELEISLFSLADILFEKRVLEYRNLNAMDTKAALTEQPGYISKMPLKVYEHWSGKKSGTPDSLIFSLNLDRCLTVCSLAIAKQLSEITVNSR